MSVFKLSLYDHFREFAVASCTKLQCDHDYAGDGVWLNDSEYGFNVRIHVLAGDIRVVSGGRTTRKFVVSLAVPIADPDSFSLVEEYLQQLNDQLP